MTNRTDINNKSVSVNDNQICYMYVNGTIVVNNTTKNIERTYFSNGQFLDLIAV